MSAQNKPSAETRSAEAATSASSVTGRPAPEPAFDPPAQVWARNPIEAFERLRDRVCDAVNAVTEIYQTALLSPVGELLEKIRPELHEPLYFAVLEAQAYWYDTTISRFLDRPEGSVDLDNRIANDLRT